MYLYLYLHVFVFVVRQLEPNDFTGLTLDVNTSENYAETELWEGERVKIIILDIIFYHLYKTGFQGILHLQKQQPWGGKRCLAQGGF